jgi:fructose-bisphosphate aldolase class II
LIRDNFYILLISSDICAARFEAFGSAGNADKIKVSSLDTMSQRYLSGELDAQIK